MQSPLLQVSDLTIRFSQDKDELLAINNISFEVNKGEIIAIVGESGSGKSITSLSILQLLDKNATFSGKSVFTLKNNNTTDTFRLSPKQMQAIRGNEIAMIFQEPMTSLNPLMTCGDQVTEVIQLHQKCTKKNALEKTIEIFSAVDLPNPSKIINRYPHQLSGGQQQRVMIAMAMSCNPQLLIADEPTTALDVTVQKNILELIKKLQTDQNMSVIFISHDLGLVADIADRIIVMYKGEIVEQGICTDILSNPKHNYTKALLACRTQLSNKKNRLPLVSDFLKGAVIHAEPVIEKKIDESVLLDVKNISVHFSEKKSIFQKETNHFKAVDDVSFSIHTGEIVGLVGESGCGKTTIGRGILQLIPLTKGEIYFKEHSLSNLSKQDLKAQRKELQIVFQDPYGSLNPRITIGEAISEPIRVHVLAKTRQQEKDKVVELLEKVNLSPDHFSRYPHQFSGGQRQRICIARALALNPSLLVFDESVSALDVSVQAQILNLINDLKREFNFSALFISHDLSVVHYISDRILVMQKGKIVEAGLAEDIYRRPQNAYTQKLIHSIPGKSLPLHS